MYTYIKDHQLFVLNPLTGRVFRIGLSLNGTDIVVVHHDTMSFNEDVVRHVQETKAILIRD